MKRPRGTGLVLNEERTLLAFADLQRSGVDSIHPYALVAYWRANPEVPSLSYATLYRCIDTLEERGLATSSRKLDAETGTRLQRHVRLTMEGISIAAELEPAEHIQRLGSWVATT